MEMNSTENKAQHSKEKLSNSGRMILIMLLCVITASAIGVSAWALWFRSAKPAAAPDYAPRQVESNAQPIESDDTSKLEQASGGGAVSLTYSKEVTLTLSAKEAALMFQNPSKSNQDMKLKIVIDDKTIAESGRLEPGYKVEKLSNVDTQKLSAGTYNGKFVVSYYDAESGEKAIVNTEIPITITVNN